jgi:uncharacterized protein (TIGR02246 family)
MKTWIVALIVAGLSVTTAIADPKSDAFAVVGQFKAAYDSANPPAIVGLFAPNGIFLGTTMQKPTIDRGEILKYFEASAASNQPKRVEVESYETMQISENVFVFSGQNIFYQTRDGKTVETLARFSFVIVKTGDGWKIGHFHSSLRPTPPR